MDLNLFPLGWVHSLACLLALALAPYIFATRKGTRRHKQLGQIYVAAMVVLNLSALGLYRLGIFFFPHWLAVITLAVIAVGWLAARFHQPPLVWRYVHLSSMIFSYYMLIGGGVNEVFLRIDVLRAVANHQGMRVINQTHAVVILVFAVMLVGWNLVEIGRAVSRQLKRRARAAGAA